jgi:hypothetical protein
MGHVFEEHNLRNAVNQASGSATTAANTGAELGGEAQGIGANLTPFLTQEMLHPQGVGQTGLSAETASAEGGAGGAASGLMGVANERAAASRNAGGFSAALDEAARQREKAAAGSSEGITAGNEMLKQQQTQEGARGLQGMYGTDTSGMLSSQGQIANDVKAEADANQTGWLQNAQGLVKMAGGIAGLGAGFGIPGFSGFKGGGGS